MNIYTVMIDLKTTELLICSQDGNILGRVIQPWTCGQVFPSQGKPFIILYLTVVPHWERLMDLDISK